MRWREGKREVREDIGSAFHAGLTLLRKAQRGSSRVWRLLRMTGGYLLLCWKLKLEVEGEVNLRRNAHGCCTAPSCNGVPPFAMLCRVKDNRRVDCVTVRARRHDTREDINYSNRTSFQGQQWAECRFPSGARNRIVSLEEEKKALDAEVASVTAAKEEVARKVQELKEDRVAFE